MKKVCFISIDVENDLDKDSFECIKSMDRLLSLFAKHNIRSTLFVTGEVLEKFPTKVKQWSKNHEIASHEFHHLPLFKLSPLERKLEIKKFNRLYYSILKSYPQGFRAVQHTIDLTQMEILEQFGYSYDSSVIPRYVPFRKYVGYKGKAPLVPYFPSKKNIRNKGVSDNRLDLIEIPVVPLIMGISLYGTWIRIFGSKIMRLLLFFKKPNYLALAMHPWDAYPYHGQYSKNSGEKYFVYLEQVINSLKKKYTFKTYGEVASKYHPLLRRKK